MYYYNGELYHHGIKGMRWGIRRFQKKGGGLTPAGKKRYSGKDDDSDTKSETKSEPESNEARRARALKSTNASEIYKNRDVLTTAEIRERMDRINVETQLHAMSEKSKKTGMDYVNKALQVGRKMNEVYEFTNTPMMKAVKKELFGEKAEKRLTLEGALKNLDKISDKDLQALINRGNNEKTLKNLVKDLGDKGAKRTNIVDMSKNIKDLSDSDLADLLKRISTENTLEKLLKERNK